MKKLVFLLVCLFSIQTMLWADNDKPIHVGQLPTKAQTLITTYFGTVANIRGLFL